jgi:hypothetical protein
LIKAFWFNNRQTEQDVLQPDFFTPKTCFLVEAKLPKTEAAKSVEVSISAICDGTVVFDKTHILEILESDGIVTLLRPVDTLERDPERLDVKINVDGNIYTKSINCEYAVISGRTTDFNDNPFPSAVIFNISSFAGMEGAIGVWSDANGYYSIRLPKGEYNSIFVDDNSYGKTSLESWGWKMLVDRDESHDFKIGNGEVYSLDVWANNGGSRSLFVYFRPMVLSCAIQAMAQVNKPSIVVSNKEYTLLEACPDITVESVSVEINGKKVANISLQKIIETTTDGNALPAYILQCERPLSMDKQTLVLEYNFRDSDGNLAQSQGRTQFYYTNAQGLAVR